MPSSKNPAPNSSSASNPSSASSPSALPANEKDVDRRLLLGGYALSARFRERTLLGAGERSRNETLETILQIHFTSERRRQKFIGLIEALITICTTDSGPDNVAAMLGLSTTHLSIFLCQNSGRPWPALQLHLQSVWRILQGLREKALTSQGPQTDMAEPQTSPRTIGDDELDLARSLKDLCYLFSANKAVHRARKHLRILSTLKDKVDADPSSTTYEKSLIHLFYTAAMQADTVWTTGLQALGQRKDWQTFRACIKSLYNKTGDPLYDESLAGIQARATALGFAFTKSLDKAVKLEAAVMTLIQLPRSPTRGDLTDRSLKVINVPLPAHDGFEIGIDAFVDWAPEGADKRSKFEAGLRQMCGGRTDSNIKVSPKIHSECELVARVTGNPELLDGCTLLPYISCSKLHCWFCHQWFTAFNVQSTSRVAFDGSHGGVKTGWQAPTLTTPLHEQVCKIVQQAIDDELFKASHPKSESASTTSSEKTVNKDPDTEEEAALVLEALTANGETLTQ
ncbi:hypothetical protein C8R47DRAFT_1215154 [Mycena vitilis]|nr:hypothetical protein C8R47DRAFT_1215154 [Mycena vitilis]